MWQLCVATLCFIFQLLLNQTIIDVSASLHDTFVGSVFNDGERPLLHSGVNEDVLGPRVKGGFLSFCIAVKYFSAVYGFMV